MIGRHFSPSSRVPAALFALLLLGTAAGTPALAVADGPYTMEVLVDGRPLEEYAARGTTYIEALREHEYSIRLTNHTALRVAVALTVDGLNTIDARTTPVETASRWILGPRESITLDGWQTGTSTARRFFFTTEERSYGAWLGRTENLGVVAAAFFRERKPRPIATPRRYSEAPEAPSAGADGSAAPPPRRAPEAERRSADADAPTKSQGLGESQALSDDLAATGIGREVDHRVRRVRFDAESTPAARVQLRYEYRDALVRLGVLPGPLACGDDALRRRETARGFEETGFAPDPYAGCTR